MGLCLQFLVIRFPTTSTSELAQAAPRFCRVDYWKDFKEIVEMEPGECEGEVIAVNGISRNGVGKDVMYNLRGQRVGTAKKPGLYIVNGRKAVMK